MKNTEQSNYSYFTCVLPYVEYKDGATKWHPTERFGPFSVLTRGAFDSEEKAHEWAKGAGIKDSTYSVRQITYTYDAE